MSALVVVVAWVEAGDEGVDDEFDDEVRREIGDGTEDQGDEQVPIAAEAGQRDEHSRSDRREIRDQTEDGGLGFAHGGESSNGVSVSRLCV